MKKISALYNKIICIHLLLLLLGTIVLMPSCKKQMDELPTGNQTLPDSLINGTPLFLAKGINLSNWFNDYSDPAQYGNRFTAKHFTTIRSLGFNNVRIPIGVNILFQKSTPSVLQDANVQWVDAAIKRATDAGLAVTINLHPWKYDMDSLLANDNTMPAKLATYWKAVATYFQKYSPQQLVFEIYNEPHATVSGLTTKPQSWWYPVQEECIKAIRSVTQQHYIIVGAENWNSWRSLPQIPIYNYARIIYNFHYYDPYVFTHQGATWADALWPYLKNVPYPSTPQNIAPLVAVATNNQVKQLLTDYGNYRYNSDTLRNQINTVVNWAMTNKVMLLCNEFGAYKNFAPRGSRLTYINDVRTILEKAHIGWAMWELDEGFGLLDYTGSNRFDFATDAEVVAALGL